MPLLPATRTRLRELVEAATGEEDLVEFKSQFDLTGSTESRKMEWMELVKDVVAIANSGGGSITFGCDSHGFPVRVDQRMDGRVDPSEITKHVRPYTEIPFSDVRIEEVQRHGELRAAWLIGPAMPPIPFTKPAYYVEGHGRRGPAFKEGLYFRHNCASELAHRDDLGDVIKRANDQYLSSLQTTSLALGPRVVYAIPTTPEASSGTLSPTAASSASASEIVQTVPRSAFSSRFPVVRRAKLRRRKSRNLR